MSVVSTVSIVNVVIVVFVVFVAPTAGYNACRHFLQWVRGWEWRALN